MLNKFFELLRDKSMVTAANTFRILGKVALNRSRFRKKITAELINVEALSFSRECKNIFAGTAIKAFSLYMDGMKDKKEMIAFAKKHLKSRRNSTRKKSKDFLWQLSGVNKRVLK